MRLIIFPPTPTFPPTSLADELKVLNIFSFTVADGSTARLRFGPDAPVASAADREELVRPDRPRSGTLRGAALVHRPAAQDRERQEGRQGLLAVRLQP